MLYLYKLLVDINIYSFLHQNNSFISKSKDVSIIKASICSKKKPPSSFSIKYSRVDPPPYIDRKSVSTLVLRGDGWWSCRKIVKIPIGNYDVWFLSYHSWLIFKNWSHSGISKTRSLSRNIFLSDS